MRSFDLGKITLQRNIRILPFTIADDDHGPSTTDTSDRTRLFEAGEAA
jgi:hypothetical protein